jgi:predicted nucleic acid-binding protein
MIVDCVLDTNILLYAVSRIPAHLTKKTRAIELVEGSNFGTTAQIVQEFFVNVVRKSDFGFTVDMAMAWIENLEKAPSHATDMTLVKNAIEAAVRWQISYWDAAILVAAKGLGAPILYTEDLNHGQAYGSVTAINPFIETAHGERFHEAPATPLSGSP